MAVKKRIQSRSKSKMPVAPEVVEVKKDEMEMEGNLDPQEEKMLDWILKGIVWFVLGWLGLSVLLVIGGYFGLWK